MKLLGLLVLFGSCLLGTSSHALGRGSRGTHDESGVGTRDYMPNEFRHYIPEKYRHYLNRQQHGGDGSSAYYPAQQQQQQQSSYYPQQREHYPSSYTHHRGGSSYYPARRSGHYAHKPYTPLTDMIKRILHDQPSVMALARYGYDFDSYYGSNYASGRSARDWVDSWIPSYAPSPYRRRGYYPYGPYRRPYVGPSPMCPWYADDFNPFPEYEYPPWCLSYGDDYPW